MENIGNRAGSRQKEAAGWHNGHEERRGWLMSPPFVDGPRNVRRSGKTRFFFVATLKYTLTIYYSHARLGSSRLIEGRHPETMLKTEGQWRPRLRLATAGSGGPGPRPPGTTTWPRGAAALAGLAPVQEARDPGTEIATVERRRARASLATTRGAFAGCPRRAASWHAPVSQHRAPSRRSASPQLGEAKTSGTPRAQCAAGTMDAVERRHRLKPNPSSRGPVEVIGRYAEPILGDDAEQGVARRRENPDGCLTS